MNFENTFYFTKEVKKKSKMYGYQVIECRIYRLDEETGFPKFISSITYNTGSTPGAENEVFMYLREHGYIKCDYQGYYFFDSEVKDQYEIHYIA